LQAREGDHPVTYPLVVAFEKYAPLTIVLLDAHLDYRDLSMDLRYTNSSPFRRIHELSFVDRIITIGARGMKSTDREYRESLGHGNSVFPMEQVHDIGIDGVLSRIDRIGNYYLSLDIDVLDPSIAPGTEVNPYLDHAELTQHIGVQLLLEAIGSRFSAAAKQH
jgi:agmatinase